MIKAKFGWMSILITLFFICSLTTIPPVSSYSVASFQGSAYSASPTITTSGGGTWGSILRMQCTISGTLGSFTLTKIDNTAFSTSGTVRLRVGANNGEIRGERVISAGILSTTIDYDFASVTGYPKDYYMTYDSSAGGSAWVGPIRITFNCSIAVPTGVTAIPLSSDTIQIRWNQVSGASRYKIKLGTEEREVSGGTTTSYNWTGLASGQQYCFTVKACAGIGCCTAESTSACANIPPPPPPNTRISGKTSTSLTVTWDSVSTATRYKVRRSGTTEEREVFAPQTTYEWVGLTSDTQYCFTVIACAAQQSCSLDSNQACDRTLPQCTPPGIPQNVSAVAESSTAIRISWAAVSGATRYKVTNVTLGNQETGDITATSYSWSGLTPGQQYCFIVKACASCCSVGSNQVCAMTSSSNTTSTIAGKIFDTNNSTGIGNVEVCVTGPVSNCTTRSNADGTFVIGALSGLATGIYTITPSLAGRTFYPTSRIIKIASGNVTGVNFYTDATVPQVSVNLPAYGSAVSGNVVISGNAEMYPPGLVGINQIILSVNGVDKAQALISPDISFNLSSLYWVQPPPNSSTSVSNWNQILPATGFAEVQVRAVGSNGKVGYSPRIRLSLGNLTASIATPTVNDIPFLSGSTVTATSSLVTGGTPPYTYQWDLDGGCPPENQNCNSATITFTVKNLFAKTLNLTVTDAQANQVTSSIPFLVDRISLRGDPDLLPGQNSAGYGVNTVSGNFFMSRTDITLPGAGLPVIFTRYYNSSVYPITQDVFFGKGWTHNYNIKLVDSFQYDKQISITWGDGTIDTWFWVNGVFRSGNMGNFGLLVKGATTYTLIDKNQTQWIFDSTGRLTTITDRQANAVVLTYTGSNLTQIRNQASGRLLTFTYDTSSRISRITDGLRSVAYAYDTNNYLASATDTRGKIERYQYVPKNSLGATSNIYLLNKVIDKNGNTVLTNEYDDATSYSATFGRLVPYRCIVQRDALNRAYTFQYSGPETVVSNPLNEQTRFGIDGANRIIWITDSRNFSSSTQYNNDNSPFKPYRANPSSTKLPNQNVSNPLLQTDFGYSQDGMSNLEFLTEPSPGGSGNDRPQHGFTYSVNTAQNRNLPVSYTDPAGNRIQIAYNTVDLPQAVTPPGTGNSTVTYTYNSKGQVLTATTVRDGVQQVTRYEYNTAGDLTAVITPLGNRTSYQYHLTTGQLTSITDPSGKTTTFTYEGDLLKTVTIPIDAGRTAITTYTYNNNGQATFIDGPDSNDITRVYNQQGLLIKVTNGAGNVTNYEHDELNRLRRQTYTTSGLNPIEQRFDGSGNLIEVKNVDLNESLTRTFDGNGNILTERDGLGRTKQYTHDHLNRVTRIDYGDGTSEQFTHTIRSQVSTYVDRNGRIKRYEFDELGRLKTVREPVANGQEAVTALRYDSVGNVVEITDPRGKVIRFVYDNDNRLISRTEDASGAALVFSFTYDLNGRLKTYTADGLTATYTYFDSGWLRSITYTGTSGTISISFTYSNNGYLTGMTDNTGTTAYTRDAVGRMLSRRDPWGNFINYQYDTFGRLQTLTYPGNKIVSYTYDAAHRIKDVNAWFGRAASYSYNQAGQLSGILYGNQTSVAYGYETATGRLLSLFHRKADNSVIASYQFTLDGNGNRTGTQFTQPTLPQIPTQSVDYSVDGANRLVSTTGTSGNKTFTFNRRGALTGITAPGGNSSFTLDLLDRLTGVSVPGVTASFKNDGQGNLLEQTVNGAVTRFVLDTNKPLADVLVEMNASNQPQRYYIYGNGLIAQTDGAGANPRYYHFDAIGSTVALTDTAQNITDSYAYDPFGNEAGKAGSTPNPFRYVGQFGVRQSVAGMHYMRARHYLPEVGRFISRDKVWGDSTMSQTLNLFAYSNNNPVNTIDPSGRMGQNPQDVQPRVCKMDEPPKVVIGPVTRENFINQYVQRCYEEKENNLKLGVCDICDINSECPGLCNASKMIAYSDCKKEAEEAYNSKFGIKTTISPSATVPYQSESIAGSQIEDFGMSLNTASNSNSNNNPQQHNSAINTNSNIAPVTASTEQFIRDWYRIEQQGHPAGLRRRVILPSFEEFRKQKLELRKDNFAAFKAAYQALSNR